MSGSVNKAIIIGHLGRDPEVRHTQAGKPVATFSVATSDTWRDKDTGERKEATEWHRVVIFNEPLAKVAEQYLKKGSKVYIEGQMKTRKWTDQAGVEKYTTEIVLQAFNSTLTLLDKREGVPAANDPSDYGTQSSSSGGAREGVAPRGSAGRSPPPGGDMDDDIPF
jgi:single-strand DNA-binding protein